MTTRNLTDTYIAPTYARAPIAFAKGHGSLLWDEDGKEYIDLGTGIAVNAFGLCDEVWQNAVAQQAATLNHVSNLYYSAPQARLAQILCERTGMKRVFFANSGAEANECAIKCARKYSSDKYGEGRKTIVSLLQSFHGRTLATLTATGQPAMHVHFGPFVPGFAYAPANDMDAIRALCDKGDVCAVMIEVVQGEGGVLPLDKAYVQELARYCDEHDILLVCDEVQCGNGRTGQLYGYMNYGITPDIVTTAKGLGGGLPIGAAMLGTKVENTLSAGSHGSTFGGNPICAAGAVSIMERVDEALLVGVREKSAYIFSELTGAKGVKAVTGLGLMIGIETEKEAGPIVAALRERGVIVLTAKTKVRLLPALNIPMELLQKAIAIIKEELAK